MKVRQEGESGGKEKEEQIGNTISTILDVRNKPKYSQ